MTRHLLAFVILGAVSCAPEVVHKDGWTFTNAPDGSALVMAAARNFAPCAISPARWGGFVSFTTEVSLDFPMNYSGVTFWNPGRPISILVRPAITLQGSALAHEACHAGQLLCGVPPDDAAADACAARVWSVL